MMKRDAPAANPQAANDETKKTSEPRIESWRKNWTRGGLVLIAFGFMFGTGGIFEEIVGPGPHSVIPSDPAVFVVLALTGASLYMAAR